MTAFAQWKKDRKDQRDAIAKAIKFSRSQGRKVIKHHNSNRIPSGAQYVAPFYGYTFLSVAK